MALGQLDYPGDDVLFPDTGYQWLPKTPGDGFHIRLGHVVRRIAWEGDRTST